MSIDQDRLYHRIGAAVRQRREMLGLSQTQLATAVGLLRTSIANLEAGRQRAPLHTLYPICVALGIEPVDILPGTREVLATDSREFRLGAKVQVVPARTAAVASELLGDDLEGDNT